MDNKRIELIHDFGGNDSALILLHLLIFISYHPYLQPCYNVYICAQYIYYGKE